MNVADYIIQRLAHEGIREAFVVYGAACGDLIDAFTRTDKIKYICAMHEQGAGFMAEGYAKISDNFGVAIATSGPGGQNFVTPIANCFYDSVPCLFITGQVKRQFMKKYYTQRQLGFQETPIVDIVKPITKYAAMITDVKTVKEHMDRALFAMKEGRPGPVLLDIPIDVQKMEYEPSNVEATEILKEFNSLTELYRNFENLAIDIKNSKRPVILVGGGCRKAINALKYLSEGLNIPVFPTWNALDIITSDMPTYGGRIGTYAGPGRNFGIQNSDLLIAIGTRISGRITGGNPSTFARGAKKWLIDIDDTNLMTSLQEVKFDHNVRYDAHAFLSSFHKYYEMQCPLEDKISAGQFDEWMNQCIAWRDKYDPIILHRENKTDFVNPYLFCEELSNQCDKKDIIIVECGGNIVIMNHSFKTKNGQRYITNNGNSAMGQAIGIAAGSWFASDKAQRVICVLGDGGLSIGLQEFQTLINYGVNIKIIVLNNKIYGITKAFQKVNFEGRSEACGPKGYCPPDFIKVANAFGITGINVDNDSETKSKIEFTLKYPKTILCNVDCFEWHYYYPKISGWKTPIEDMEPLLSREEFKSNMVIDPLPGWENNDYK